MALLIIIPVFRINDLVQWDNTYEIPFLSFSFHSGSAERHLLGTDAPVDTGENRFVFPTGCSVPSLRARHQGCSQWVINSVRTGASSVLLTTVDVVPSTVPTTSRAGSRSVEQRGKRTHNWLLTDCQLASPVRATLWIVLAMTSVKKARLNVTLLGDHKLTLMGRVTLLIRILLFVLTGYVNNKATWTLINPL